MQRHVSNAKVIWRSIASNSVRRLGRTVAHGVTALIEVRALVANIALSLFCTGAAQSACMLPPDVSTRIGRAQIFMNKSIDRQDMKGRRDFIWADRGGDRVEGAYATRYMAGTRDTNTGHDLRWYENNHPDWLARQCDRTSPAMEHHRYVPVDFTNMDVREHLYDDIVAPIVKTNRYDGIALDNISALNVWRRCGIATAGGTWRQLYSGDKLDRNYTTAVRDWLAWLRAKLNDNDLCLAANLTYNKADIEGYFDIVDSTDIVIDEGGSARRCRPTVLGNDWLKRITVMRRVAAAKPLVTIEKMCEKWADIDKTVVTWAVANFLLTKGSRSYLYLSSDDRFGQLTDLPELYLDVGKPLGDFGHHEGLYTRTFEKVLAVVNPSETEARTLAVPGNQWRTLDGGSLSDSVIVQPSTAMVLVKDRSD